MNNSYVVTEKKLANLSNVAQPFVSYLDEVYPYTKDYPYLSKKWALEQGLGSGGIKSSASDMAKWLIFNMNNGATEKTRLISARNMDFIHSPQTAINSSVGDIKEETELAYGEGWFIDKQEYQPYTLLYHPGGGTGMHALMAYIPEEKIGIIILTNTWGNKVPEVLYKRWFDLYFNKPLKDWSKLYLQEKVKAAADAKSRFEPDQCQIIKFPNLEKYVGIYYNPVYGNLVILTQG